MRPAELDADLVWCEHRSPPRPAPALFLDRDGVVVEEVGHLHEVAKTRLIPGAAAVVAEANRRGLHVVLVTNQSGIGRGLYDWDAFRAVQEKILAELAAASIDAVLACPHHAEVAPPYRHPDHPDRKPNPGMLLKAAAMLEIELAASWIVGDRAGDIEAGRRAGLAGGLHVATGHGAEERAAARALATSDFRVIEGDSVVDALTLLPLLAA
ncbi:MAG: HAD family hydrolase [Alphaproteobacteria bacterium]|jgi:D-glycero-D-manno-heptose 1,7-bisphosphate phosphatase|nr:HAD family hydrolase [Alphaproteobacteria bacterium]